VRERSEGGQTSASPQSAITHLKSPEKMENSSRKPKDPARSGCRRANFHDYSSPAFYMITINKNSGVPAFSTIEGEVRGAVRPFCRLSESGWQISRSFGEILVEYPQCRIVRQVIMPDHIHFIMEVRQYLEGFTLSKVINRMMGRCTSSLRKSGLIGSETSAFTRGFNDKLLMRDGQLHNWLNYISENPRRRLIQRQCREYFTRRQVVEIAGELRSVYGNFMLLRHPEKVPGIVSSRYSEAERAEYERRWTECFRSRGVLVSPFISKAEKELYRQAVDSGASLIQIVNEGLPERYKPYGEQFALCASGRLLIIAAPTYDAEKQALGRGDCMSMNSLARKICSLTVEAMRLRRPD
ncbi:MAG: hypothetical protein K2H03_08475, partial [Muribaculaceae bacterium]|nr:hypothetical protein [Muribaculaceae bacterium]